MKTHCVTAALLLASASMFGQANFPAFDPDEARQIPDNDFRASIQAEATFGTAAVTPGGGLQTGLPTWTYQVTAAQNGRMYTGQIVGTNPFNTEATTTIPVVLVPVIFQITQGGVTYSFDPMAADPGCIPGSAFDLMQQSPLFQNASFVFNGVDVGSTQYGDAFLRAEFWTYTASKPDYHVLLNATVSTSLTISINAGARGNVTAEIYSAGSQCGYSMHGLNPPGALAVINGNTVDAILQSYIQASGFAALEFPFFITYNAVLSMGAANNLANCCVLGYHNQLRSGQTYGLAEFEGRNQTVFRAVSDVSSASHEITEWLNDPSGVNPTPRWGNIGQVGASCQGNLEVGDPLSNSLLIPVLMSNSFSYHLQELAYFSWFYGGASLGAGGVYSNNGTFAGAAKLCPPGGTN